MSGWRKLRISICFVIEMTGRAWADTDPLDLHKLLPELVNEQGGWRDLGPQQALISAFNVTIETDKAVLEIFPDVFILLIEGRAFIIEEMKPKPDGFYNPIQLHELPGPRSLIEMMQTKLDQMGSESLRRDSEITLSDSPLVMDVDPKSKLLERLDHRLKNLPPHSSVEMENILPGGFHEIRETKLKTVSIDLAEHKRIIHTPRRSFYDRFLRPCFQLLKILR